MYRLFVLLAILVDVAQANGGEWYKWGTLFGSLIAGAVVIGVLMCLIYKMCVSSLVERHTMSRPTSPGHKAPPNYYNQGGQPPVYTQNPYISQPQPYVQQQQGDPNQNTQNLSVATGSSFVSQGLPASGAPHTPNASGFVPVLSQEPGRYQPLTTTTHSQSYQPVNTAYQLQPIPPAFGTATAI